MEHRGLLLTLRNSFDRINIGREGSPGDRNNMKKCMEELSSEAASDTDSHWQQNCGEAWALGVGQ